MISKPMQAALDAVSALPCHAPLPWRVGKDGRSLEARMESGAWKTIATLRAVKPLDARANAAFIIAAIGEREKARALMEEMLAALETMTDRLDPPPLPVCFLLDELATLGHLPAVENAVGLAAGYGIQLWSVFQDIAQMRELYRGRWASFIGNSGIRAIFNLDDFDTADYWSKFMGGRLVETYSREENIFGLSQGRGVGTDMRPLRAAEELMTDYAKAKMLVLAQGEHPIEAARVPYFRDDTLKGLWDDPRYPVPPLPAPVTKRFAVRRQPEDAEPSHNGREGRAYVLERE